MSILIGPETRLVVQGITGREGEFHSRAMQEYGTPIVAGMTPGKGGQTALDGTVPVFDTVAEAVRETGANTSCIFVPAAGAPDAVMEAAAAGIATIFCITEGIPALDMIPVVEAVARAGARLIGPNCPGATSPGSAKVGIIPGSIHRAGAGRRREPVGDADLRGGPGDDRRGRRPVDLHRDRRRPDHRDDLPRHPPALRGRSRDRRHRAHRRDRRGGRGDGRGLGGRPPRGRPEGRLHRRPDRARGQADGPRRRDHLGRRRDGRVQGRGARGGRLPGRRLADRAARRSSATPATGADRR